MRMGSFTVKGAEENGAHALRRRACPFPVFACLADIFSLLIVKNCILNAAGRSPRKRPSSAFKSPHSRARKRQPGQTLRETSGGKRRTREGVGGEKRGTTGSKRLRTWTPLGSRRAKSPRTRAARPTLFGPPIHWTDRRGQHGACQASRPPGQAADPLRLKFARPSARCETVRARYTALDAK